MKTTERFVYLAFACIFATMGRLAFARIESPYVMYLGLGKPYVNYGGKIDRVVDALGASRNETATLDIGFYWLPPNRKTLIGGIGNGIGERYKRSGETTDIFQISWALTAMHFFSEEIGKGLFFRGDLGLSRLFWETSSSDDWSNNGFGFLIGGGYALPIRNTSILLNLNYAMRRFDSENQGTFSLNVGGLFSFQFR